MSKAEELFKIAEQNNTTGDFIKSGNCFIIEDKYNLAALSFERAGHIYITNDNKYLAASMYVKASDNYVKDNQCTVAQNLLNTAINIYLEDGKFTTAAHQLENLAILYSKDKQITLAIENYVKAHKYFCVENSQTTAISCLYKAGQLAIEYEKYDEAINLLNQVNEYYETNELMLFRCKQLMLEIAILKLFSISESECRSYLSTQKKHKETREYTLLTRLINDIEESNKEKFVNAFAEFNSIQPLEEWKTKLLLSIKERI